MGGSVTVRVPLVAISGSQARPVVITACSCRRIAATMTVWAWVAVSLFFSRLVRCLNLARRRCCRVGFPRPLARPRAAVRVARRR